MEALQARCTQQGNENVDLTAQTKKLSREIEKLDGTYAATSTSSLCTATLAASLLLLLPGSIVAHIHYYRHYSGCYRRCVLYAACISICDLTLHEHCVT